jgi:hypothetical protein
MPRKTIPYIFLATLLAILLFIIGVRYGQHVEQINKNASYLTSIPPTPTTAPTILPLGFSTYTHPDCGVSFLIPNLIEKTKESSNSALFSTDKKQLAIALSCEKKPFIQEKNETIITVNGVIRAFQTETIDTASYRFYNAKKAKIVVITASKSYVPLIQKSLSITP